MTRDLETQIEAVLFYRAEPMRIPALAKLCETTEKEIERALAALEKHLVGRGVILVRDADMVEIRTAPAASALIEKLSREELTRDIGKAGSETLALILYRDGATRSEIDWVRGVNSSYTLRELAARGLIKRGSRTTEGYRYEPTAELMAHLGVARATDLPAYAHIKKELLELKI
jgi:segregation and condensation protein B